MSRKIITLNIKELLNYIRNNGCSADLSDYFNKSEIDDKLDTKQNTLTAGDNISIDDNVISATTGSGGGSSDVITLPNCDLRTIVEPGVYISQNGMNKFTNTPSSLLRCKPDNDYPFKLEVSGNNRLLEHKITTFSGQILINVKNQFIWNYWKSLEMQPPVWCSGTDEE